ncbi:MAG TPA: OmpH family outer membrane protein [Allosphingosinicella sp.]|nr:OmpH family outer membrane protein [Allosphingosinicella sp.]
MKKLAIGAAVALSFALPATAPAQRAPNAQIVLVDTERVYRECTACRAAQAQLQTMQTQLQQRAQALGQPIETELQSIQQAAAAARNTTGAARTTAETQLQQRLQALEGRRTTAQQELARMEQNLRSTSAHVVQQINQRLNPIITQVMNQRGANLALDVGATLAHSGALNVTDAVLAALNAALPSVSVTPLPAQPGQQQPAQQPQPGR